MIVSGFKIKLLLAGIVVSVLSGGLFGAGDDFFARQEINVSGIVLGVREGDFDADSRTDLAVFTTDGEGRRFLNLFIQRQSGRFPPSADPVVEISRTTNMVQCRDLNGDGRSEIYTVAGDGLRQYRYREGGFEDNGRLLVPEETILVGGIEHALLPHQFIFDINARAIAFLPIAEGMIMFEYRQDKFRPMAQVNFSHLMKRADRPVKLFGNDPGIFSLVIPDIEIADGNGDGREDIYLIWPDRLIIFDQNDNGRFDPEDRADIHFQSDDDDNLCQSSLIDYDRDGLPDLVCSRSNGGISGAVTEICFYGSDRLRGGVPRASHTITITDAVGNLLIDDVDGNGTVELIVSAIETGTMTTVQMMITSKTDFHLLIYPVDNLGRPAREPEVRREVTCRLDFSHSDPTSEIRYDWSADYNGDGWRDMIFADGGGRLMFYSGRADEYIESKPSLVVDVTDADYFVPTDLNRDNNSDLIVIHRPREKTTRLTLLVTTRIG